MNEPEQIEDEAEPAVRLEIEDGVARLTLNRPDALNAMSPTLMDGLAAGLDRIEANGNVRVVVLTGTGRAFCAGGDLKFLRETLGLGEREAFISFLRRGQTILRRLETLPVPTIAAVNGVAVAGGLELILCCDLVVACESARIGDGHAKFGIIPGGGASIRLPRKVPVAIAKELFFSADLVAPEVLARWGLINQVAADGELGTAVDELVGRIAGNSPLGLRWMKQLVDEGLQQPLDTALRSEVHAFESYAASDDIMEGLTAFGESRAPKFSGR